MSARLHKGLQGVLAKSPSDTVILPGRSAIWEFTLQEPVVPMDKVFEGATVQLKGTWNAVWTKEKKNVDYTSFEEGTPANETLTGPFRSNVIDIEVV